MYPNWHSLYPLATKASKHITSTVHIGTYSIMKVASISDYNFGVQSVKNSNNLAIAHSSFQSKFLPILLERKFESSGIGQISALPRNEHF